MFSVYAVFDSKAEEFGSLILARNDAVAVRMFTAAVLDGSPENNFRKYPEDYEFVRVGEFDEESGQLVGCDPVPVVSALQVVNGMVKNGEVIGESPTKL